MLRGILFFIVLVIYFVVVGFVSIAVWLIRLPNRVNACWYLARKRARLAGRVARRDLKTIKAEEVIMALWLGGNVAFMIYCLTQSILEA